MKSNSDYIIFTDGGARGNPGPAAIGFLIFDQNNKLVFKNGKRIGKATNNVAEYSAVIAALKWLDENNIQNISISFFLDSNLVVSQVSGIFKIKDQKLKELFREIKILENKISAITNYSHIPREENLDADKIVNMALDHII